MPPPSGAQKVTPQLYPSLAKASSKGENEGGQTARRGTRRGAGREEKGGREGMSVIFSQSNNRANSFLPYPPMFFSFPPANRGWLVACVALHSNPRWYELLTYCTAATHLLQRSVLGFRGLCYSISDKPDHLAPKPKSPRSNYRPNIFTLIDAAAVERVGKKKSQKDDHDGRSGK